MSELLNKTMRPDLYSQLPVDLQIMQDGLEEMRRNCEQLKRERDEARATSKEYRDKFCATIISKHEKLPWEE
jgi:hypothetical protein